MRAVPPRAFPVCLVPPRHCLMLRFLLAKLVMVTLMGACSLGALVARADDSEPNASRDQADKSHDAAELAFFERRIRPVLVERCYECHSAAAQQAGKLKGELLLDSRPGVLQGGPSGPAVVPGDVEASLLLSAIRHEDLEMPPDGRLDADVISAFETWIRRGAFDPRAEAAGVVQVDARAPIDFAEARKFWAFQPPRKSSPPQVANTSWPRSDIDRFLLARLEAVGLEPVGDADRHTLLRRVTFDLTGLPPTPEAIESYLADHSDEAWSRVVDRLLASPEFGERWGRHWLDVARYADSNGGGVNIAFDNAWRYRDYVIAAINADKPYDRFLREQLAGDLLPYDSPQQQAEQIVATGFLMVGNKPLGKYDKEALVLDVADEQIDLVGRALMGLTLGCARCHDHMFDPVPMADYYALAGIFASTHSVIKKKVISGIPHVRLPLDERNASWYEARKEQIGQAFAQAAADIEHPHDEAIRIRGQLAARGQVVPRGFLQVARFAGQPDIPNDESGRRQLAEWLTDPAHPLTARVMVNRVWHHLFGRGLVATVDNFGARGQRPSHPRLLDHLAIEFREDNWSLKRLIRRLVHTRAYRLASTGEAELLTRGRALDPDNALLWRARGRRLDVEAMRDSILAISDRLDRTRGGPTLTFSGRYEFSNSTRRLKVPDPSRRRGVYLPIVRDHLDMVPSLDILEVFDFANPSFVTGRRNATIVPTQALYLMNSEFVTEQAEHAARRLLRATSGQSDRERVARFFLTALTRPPSATEVDGALELLQDVRAAADVSEAEAGEGPDLAAWTVLCQTIFASSEFVFLN
ncbi:MAG: DUF1553 domain-containing protein [Planctomycetota bacterium]|nr:MAG: DUF1553 domain-containing protein [Planctomycetota bacterium]REK39744.1 MAG: DUF1553 domain-containing protein [Planctomycetota bacterium]